VMANMDGEPAGWPARF